jgi:uncharacterized protein (TIGR02466 family)
MNQTPDILHLFAVPIALGDLTLEPGVNTTIAAWVLDECRRDAGIQRSNVGGWHSRPDLPVRGVPALDALFAAVVESVRSVHGQLGSGPDHPARFMLQAWATVQQRGDHVQVHDHAESHWSLVYYVDAGDSSDPASGRISWINPIGAARAMPGLELVPTSFNCTPRSGLLVIFPGWLRHVVEPYLGRRPRIAIAANIEVRHDSG